YRVFNSLFVDKDGKWLGRHLSDPLTHRLPVRIVRIFGFVDLSCTGDSGCLPRVNGIDRMFSFLNLQLHG
ncbi:MAG: hypothetical protein ACPHX8_06690, partial [Candidatus Poseidoniaceae archaeon]